MNTDDDGNPWLAVIGRALAFLCLAQADLRDKGLASQARFLEGLGLRRKEAAALLGTTEASISETLSRERRSTKGRKRGRPKRTS